MRLRGDHAMKKLVFLLAICAPPTARADEPKDRVVFETKGH